MPTSNKGRGYYTGPQYEIPREAWGEGCHLDFENNILYGADGETYENVQINRADLERYLRENDPNRPPQPRPIILRD